ncbi:MAG: sugar phosphate isomerase/epimerase family protein [Oceanidesulfovibrio sp.]
MALPKLAITNQAFSSSAETLAFCRSQECFEVEYTFPRNLRTIHEITNQIEEIEFLLEHGCNLRYHLAFHQVELADANPGKARLALRIYEHSLRTAAYLGGHFATIHVCLNVSSMEKVNRAAAVDSVGALVSLGKQLGIQVCLENLRKGWTNSPQGLRALLDETGAWATLDIGHAVARELAEDAPGYALDYIDLCGERILEAHVYEVEVVPPEGGPAYHLAPQDLSRIRALLDHLNTSSACDYWLIELQQPAEVARTMQLLQAYTSGRKA